MQIAQLKKGKPYLFTDVTRWGGKGDNLLRLNQVFNVPPGFIISSDTFNDWIKDSRLSSFLLDVLSSKDSEEAYQSIRQRFLATGLQGDLVSRLDKEFRRMETPIAIRSSSV
ncbi:hypothetical protein HYX18_02330, partial [Candidatus Woesearchaeota archaeon]|nr:hypothetical protein [Candidatus Woesearchaeota archaeon]